MGNSAGVNAQSENTPPTEAEDIADKTGSSTHGAEADIEWDEIPIDYSESPIDSKMSGRNSRGSQDGSPKKNQSKGWTPHDRYFRRYYWYGNKRPWPRACERDRHFGYSPEAPKPSELGQEEVMPKIDNPKLESGLHVTGVDLHLRDNTQNHRTNMYQCTGSRRCHPTRKKAELVIRRGAEFLMTLKFSRRCDLRNNDVTLIFNLGDNYWPNKNLNATVKVDGGDTSYIPNRWGATCVSQDGTLLTLAVYVPACAPVGEWEFSVTTVVDVRDGKNIVWQYNHNEDINIIFNPWCKDDWVYLEDDKWRRETVLNDSGVYYHGSHLRMAASPWFYGQFEDGILEAAFHLLRRGCGYQATPSMANPASVTRTLAEIIYADADKGVIKGEWMGDYKGGTAPTKWKGSDKILRRYMATGKPVRYGQCWVFAGILTSLCRALGIPSRCVTNYSCGQNTDTAHLSIDYFIVRNDKGDWMEVSDDSIWSSHVWSEVWMKRSDLNRQGKYDGWQAVDPTPLERSDGVYCSGPCPVRAIKDGDLGVHKDTAFMFSQVNADKVIWREDEVTGRLVETRRLKSLVGKMISTHEPTGRPYRGASMKTYGGKQKLERLDITSAYKYEEESKRERMVVQKAERAFRLTNACLNNYHNDDDDDGDHDVDRADDITIEIVELGDIFVGSGFPFKVLVENTGSRNRSVRRVFLKVFYKTYFGANTGVAVFRKFGGFQLEPYQSETLKMDVSAEVAAARPQDGFHYELQAMVELRDRDYILTETMPFLLRRPNIRLKGPSTCDASETIEVEVAFTNPLSVSLTDCEVNIEGSLSCEDPTEDNFVVPDIKPLGTWKTLLFLKPKPHHSGKKLRDLSLVLESTELKDIIGYYAVTVDREN